MNAAEELAARLGDDVGGQLRCVLLYGSKLLQTRPDRHSAFDFVVVVPEYRPFYRALKDAGELHRPVWLMTALAGVLPPNVMAYVPDDGRLGIAKCLIVSAADFAAALGDDPPDHFLLGRMVQRVATVWSASDEAEAWVQARLAEARCGVLTWLAPYLKTSVDAEGLGRRMLEVCYQGEFRPEAKNRAIKISDAQSEHFREHFAAVLEAGVKDGRLERVPHGGPDQAPDGVPDGSDRVEPGDRDAVAPADRRFRLASPVSEAERGRWRRHFRRSKLRATLRWFKHMVTFANWLPYIQRKVERHTGRDIRLTRLERALPIVFLWPRAIHVLLTRPKQENGS